jgi:alkaline phosphatase
MESTETVPASRSKATAYSRQQAYLMRFLVLTLLAALLLTNTTSVVIANDSAVEDTKAKTTATKEADTASSTTKADAEDDAKRKKKAKAKSKKPVYIETKSRDVMREMQHDAVKKLQADWGYWGSAPNRYSTWMNHSNRLIPIYTFGISLDSLHREGSVYTKAESLEKLYGKVPEGTLVEQASYYDQTDVYRLQKQALAEGKTQVILIVFDGMDWNSTYNAAIYKNGEVTYREGRGNGLSFQDYRGTVTDFGWFVTSPRLGNCTLDVDAQTVIGGDKPSTGGYDPTKGGTVPGLDSPPREYLMGLDRTQPHTVTDSASSATSMTAGIKTYNAAINVDVLGNHVETIAHQLQRDRDFAIGVVTSVPISHATPAAAYAHNVSRDDYQDLTRDLIGLPSVSHRRDPLPGVDVLIGCGWGEEKKSDAAQGANFVPGRAFFDPEDFKRVSIEEGGKYVVAQRTPGKRGVDVLRKATKQAIKEKHRLLGIFGAVDGHLPFATADGQFNPTLDAKGETKYTQADVDENPVLADMAVAALDRLQHDEQGFWLMIEAGDVDWANHANNIDSSVGAVFSGESAVQAVFDWIDARDDWDKTAVIVTADHGHYFNLTSPEAIAKAGVETRAAKSGTANSNDIAPTSTLSLP